MSITHHHISTETYSLFLLPMKFKIIGIVGAGTMGAGIAQVAATAGHKVVVYDNNADILSNSQTKLDKILIRLIEKGRINSEEKARIQGNLTYANALSGLKESDLVIEAIIENAEIKHNVFKELEGIVSEDCIIASNTSSLSITSLAASLEKPQRFIGIHFFNPAPLMKLVEIIPAIQTEAKTTSACKELIKSWGKLVVQAKDTPGFIVNKVARPFYSEALRIFEEGIVPAANPQIAFATIDWAMKELGGFKMGPFELMDFIGNDVNYAVTESVFHAFYNDPRYKPAFTQKRLSEAGYLGRKTGKGYYNYGEEVVKPEPVKDSELGQAIANRIITMLINEAADTLHFRIASKEDIDTAMTTGTNYPKGLFKWADEIGIRECVNRIDELYNEYHEDRYRCSPLLRGMARNGDSFY